MSSEVDVVVSLGSIAVALGISYSVYWAFSIRSALARSLYRHQALGIGLVGIFGEFSILVAALLFVYDLGSILKGVVTPLFLASGLTVVGFELALFYWIDSSILAARRSDPLLRDTFGWRRLRFLTWILLIVLGIASVALPQSVFQGDFSSTGVLLGYLPVFVVVLSGAVVLPIAARRSGDATLRKHLAWFALFVAGIFLSNTPNAVQGLSSGQGDLLAPSALSLGLQYLIGLGASYFIYRSVRSLAPLNKLSLSD